MNPVIFLDRDGTLNPDPGYISSVNDFEFFKDTLEALGKLSNKGFKFVIITNQSGIARGLIKEKNVLEIHRYIADSFRMRGIELLGIYYCPHHPDENCNCRKPKTGLFKKAAEDYNIDLSNSYMIGDTFMDIEAGNSLNMTTLIVQMGNRDNVAKKISEKSFHVDFIGNNLMDCADFILNKEKMT